MTDEFTNYVRRKEKEGLPLTQAIIAACQHFLNQHHYDRDRASQRIKRLEEKAYGKDAE